MIVRFDCDTCSEETYIASSDCWLVRGDSDRIAMRCRQCGRLNVGAAEPLTFETLMNIGVRIVGDAELELLREFEDPNPPTAC